MKALPTRAVLVGVQLPHVSDVALDASLDELGRLVTTLGYAIAGRLTQKRPHAAGALVLGEGKLTELAAWTSGPGHVAPAVKRKVTKAAEKRSVREDAPAEPAELAAAERADVVVFDCELTPSQLRNLESATGAIVLDRTGVIIEIFSRHARSRAAKLQVEIARLTYLAPRIRETGGGRDREGGGIGGKGAGESSQELDKRRIRDRIKELKTELAGVQHEGGLRRQRRLNENSVALVGYTNAGKSSLMRAMTGSEVLVADKLFATLDTTVRPLYPATVPNVLISDTVGFIKHLPHDLVASFRSTLDEALNADLLLFVVDASDPLFREQLAVSRQVLGEIGALEVPQRLILNKRDRLSPDDLARLRKEFPDAMALSTRDADDLKLLRETLITFFERDAEEAELTVPFATTGAIGEIRRTMRVLAETFTEHGCTLRVRAPAADLARVRARYRL